MIVSAISWITLDTAKSDRSVIVLDCARVVREYWWYVRTIVDSSLGPFRIRPMLLFVLFNCRVFHPLKNNFIVMTGGAAREFQGQSMETRSVLALLVDFEPRFSNRVRENFSKPSASRTT